MAYFGKQFVMDRQENFRDFVESLKLEIPPEVKAKYVGFTPSTKVDKNGDEYTVTNNKIDGTTVSKTFKLGVEYEDTFFGRQAKVVTTLDGDTFTQVHMYPERILTFTRKFSADELVETIANSKWDGEAKRIYKAK